VTQFGAVSASRVPSRELGLDLSAAGGWRWRDVLVFVGWGVVAYQPGDDAMQVRFWGGAFAGVDAVVRRFVELQARVEVLDGGAAVDATATVWLARRFGLTAGIGGGHGAFSDSPVEYDRAGAQLAVAAWLSHRLAGSLGYALTWQRGTPVTALGIARDDFAFLAHVLTLTVTSRPPL
jgi:hypothetical protein